MSPPFLLRRPAKDTFVACYSRYLSDEALAQYCDAHYGPDKLGAPNFAARLVRLCVDALENGPRRRALDLGCALGRASFELANHFEQVIAIDISPRFIEVARRLQARGRLGYQLVEEGELLSDQQVRLVDFGLATNASRVEFVQGDARQLDARLGEFDLVLAANLIDRLSDPGGFLTDIHRHVAIGGLLGIASPYNWMESFTPRRQWLGGWFRGGVAISSLQGVARALGRHFTAVGAPCEVEFVLRENSRKFQYYLSQLSLWRRLR